MGCGLEGIVLAERDDDTYLTRAQVREVDRRAIREMGIPGIVLMENAGRNAAGIIRRRFDKRRTSHARSGTAPAGDAGFVAIVCGRGNNGGDGFVIARHLANAGIPVELFLGCDPGALAGDAATNFEIVRRMGLPRRGFDTAERIAAAADRLGRAAIIVDALLGTGFHGQVRPPLNAAIEAINSAARAWTVAIDLPSGLDCDTGRPSNATVRADETISFVARKAGFAAAGAATYTGEVHVADIGAPPALIQAVLSADGSG